MFNAKIIFLSVVILVLGSVNLNAQLYFNISTNHEYNSNPFRQPEKSSDYISSYDLGLQYDFSDWAILYYGSYSSFMTSYQRNFYWHQIGSFMETESYMFGFYGEQRLNKTEFSIYDYNSLTGYFKKNLEFDFLNTIISSSFSYSNYMNLSEFSNYNFDAGLKFVKNFETKTTFIADLGFNYKLYPNGVDSVAEQSVISSNNGKGKGNGKGSGNIIVANHTSEKAESVSQISGGLRVAQSISENIGAAGYFSSRYILNSNRSTFSFNDFNSGTESELYDDPTSRNEIQFGLETTMILPYSFSFKTSIYYSDRNYPGQGVFLTLDNYNTETERKDIQRSFQFNLSKTIPLNEETGSNLNIGFGYNFMQNNSNSYWYNYNVNSSMINLSLQF